MCDLRSRKIKSTFFHQMNELLDWESIRKTINKYYTKGQSATGTPAYDGVLLFKVCLLQTWYGLSDYEVEDGINDSISFSYFCGMSIEELVPDHSTISRFRTLMTKKKVYDKLYYKGQGSSAKLMVASAPEGVPTFLRRAKQEINDSKDSKIKKLGKNVTKAKNLYKEINKLDNSINSGSDKKKKEKKLATLKSKIAQLSQQLDPLTIVFKQEEYPPAMLPPFANGVKAKGFTAEYLSKKQLDSGQKSTKNPGNGRGIPGWTELKDAGLTKSGPKYVRMHLLSEALGGKASDSNLTPAPGPTVNVPFASGIERKAYKHVKDHDGKRIWYTISVSHHSGDQSNYPKKITAKFGDYTKEGNKFKKKMVGSPYSKSMDAPFRPAKFYINGESKTGAELGQIVGIDRKLGDYVLTVRNKYSTFMDSNAVRITLNRYKQENANVKLTDDQILEIMIALQVNKDKISYKKVKK